jgi:formate dehydrogenase iron-sulfur subunit
VSAVVRLWKGATKPLALGALAFAALAGFFNYVRTGPKETGPEDELAARREKEKAHG